MAETNSECSNDSGEAQTRRVRVGYQSTGFGLALVIDDGRVEDRTCGADGGGDRPAGARCHRHGGDVQDATDGVLRVDAVITLEIPMIDGRPAVLAWDPAEVDWDALSAG